MKTIVKLLIVALFVNAAVHAGRAAWRYAEFKEAVTQEARLRGGELPKLKQRILELAEEHEVDLAASDVDVARDGTATTVSAAYLDYIELLPSLYTREHLFEFEVSVTPVRPVTAEDLK